MFDAPVWLALAVAVLATLLAMLTGLPLAWLLGRRRFRGRALLETATLLPLVVPAPVLGYYLLVLLGAPGPLGRWLGAIGIPLAFTWEGAVLAAWVGAFPLFTRSAQAGFELVDRRLEDAARTLGRSEWSVFWRVTVPLAWRAVVGGILLGFGRAVGEFAITLVVADRIPGYAGVARSSLAGALRSTPLDAADQLGLLAVVLAV
ncbi:MAG TPA: ABC transporter permease subunit, partial [Gemmatimonadales bacterium]|nr:ABC transporter permease subunit [Gemmatimonadales bacterium]